MTTLIFRQGGNNSRIGNTFVWVENARSWCDQNDFGFVFSPGVNMFSYFFRNCEDFFYSPNFEFYDRSGFLINEKKYVEMFGRISTTVAQNSGSEKGVVQTILPNSLGYLSMGAIKWDSVDGLCESLRKFSYVIVDEPFPFSLESPNPPEGILEVKPYVESLLVDESKRIYATVHVRQGDYVRWQDGKYYKDDKFYNSLIRELVNRTNKRIAVVHNGEFSLDSDLLSRVYTSSWSDGYPAHINDLLTIACSSYVLGPYSTFSRFSCALNERIGKEPPTLTFFDCDADVDSILKDVIF